MYFTNHGDLAGRHATLSPSTYHWINYSDEKLEEWFHTRMSAMRGTALHDFAHQAITLGIRLPKSDKTLNLYVNDAIGFKMKSEQILYYSDTCFGTADAIKYDERLKLLRIHDLKTGTGKVSFHQLEVYAAIFCLEYDVKPSEIKYELRIYQNDEVVSFEPELHMIVHIMDRIVTFDKRIKQMNMEAFS